MIIFFYCVVVVVVGFWFGEFFFHSFLQMFFGGMENLSILSLGIEIHEYLVFLCPRIRKDSGEYHLLPDCLSLLVILRTLCVGYFENIVQIICPVRLLGPMSTAVHPPMRPLSKVYGMVW